MWTEIYGNMSGQTKLFITVIVLFTAYFHIRSTPDNRLKAPAFLTTLGILGTFVGIALGLMDFNPNDVQKSVPMLIDGIKTAVWASACGILCALTVKLRDILFVKKKAASTKISGATIDDLANLLKSVDENIEQVSASLIGGEGSLLKAVESANRDSNDRLNKLTHSLDNFYTNIAESNSRALVKALNEVVTSFNTNLKEQFGENFKQLNVATEKMLEWQKQYSQQMTVMIEQQQAASQNMAVASESYKALVAHGEAFNSVARSMSGLLTGLEAQRHQIDESLRSLAAVLNAASTGLPLIEEQIIEMTKQVTSGVKITNDEFNTNVKKMIEHTKEQVLVLDNALSEELTKSLESFGRQMASLSQKFASDYGPITERLQAVLKIAG